MPRRWPGLQDGHLALGRVEEPARPAPGVLAHQYFGYLGDEFPGLKGREVRIIAVLRRALEPNCDVDAEGYFLTSDDAVARYGGVTRLDRVAIAHFRDDGSLSVVEWSARAVDLACFRAAGARPKSGRRT